MRRTAPILAALVLLTAAGCGDGGSSGGSTIIPAPVSGASAFQIEQVPVATAASTAVEQATSATTHVILDGFTDGDATEAPHVFLAPPTFEFTSSVEWEIDFDSLNRNGQDRFPNLTGTVLLTAQGVLSGTWLAGEASYTVQVEVLTDVEATHPGTDVVTVIPAGALWSYSLVVTWDITDAQNWVVTANSSRSIIIEDLTVTDGDLVKTIDITGTREVATTITKENGEVTRVRVVSGSATITVDDGTEVTTIVLEFLEDGTILVTVNDEEFGPFTPAEFRAFFGCEAGNRDDS
jgi:hypothetical protein